MYGCRYIASSYAVRAVRAQLRTETLFQGTTQGDHIGLIFAYWAIVYFGRFV
jgi:hypothetical protein